MASGKKNPHWVLDSKALAKSVVDIVLEDAVAELITIDFTINVDSKEEVDNSNPGKASSSASYCFTLEGLPLGRP